MDTLGYQALVHDRLVASGYTVRSAPPSALVGYRRDFRVRWFATTLHLLVHVATTPHVTADGLARFTRASLDHAKLAHGGMRGMQSGVGVVSVVVGDSADEDAHAYALTTTVRDFAAFAWPAVVDLDAQVRSSRTAGPMVGAVYNSWMRAQIDALLPQPDALVGADPR